MMGRSARAAGLMCLTAGLAVGTGDIAASAQNATPAPAAAAMTIHGARTVQQDFDAAEALDAGTDKAAALAAWETLEKRVADRPRSRAIVLVRKSAALLALNQIDDAAAAAQAGLALLPTGDASLAADRYQASLDLGRIAKSGIDYATALDWFGRAEAAAQDDMQRMAAILAIVQTATFVDPALASAAMARADALLAGKKLDGKTAGAIADTRGLLLLNRGDVLGAQSALRYAVAQFGGLTSRVDLNDAAVRSDAAIALLLGGKDEEARRYTAMTGAGGIGEIDPGVAMVPPDCGGEAGLKPDDMAVVEFSVADDGTVRSVRPIYAAGGGRVALEFAQAVRRWSWKPDQVKAMPLFLRYTARVEMRCNLAFARPSIGDALDADLVVWGRGKGLTFAEPPLAPGTALAEQRRALAAAEAGGDTVKTLPPLFALARNPVVPGEEQARFAARALALATANGAPATARLGLDLTVRVAPAKEFYKAGVYRRLVEPLLEMRDYANDAQARSAIRLLIADHEQPGARKTSEALLQQVAADTALSPQDPLKVGAMIRLAAIAQERGDVAAARSAFSATGLSADQCALIDKEPAIVSFGGDTYPDEARRWGIGGWTRSQFDVAADGTVRGARAIVSYPPFIFSKPAMVMWKTARFGKTYRPDGGVGCGALTKNVRYRLG